MENLKDLTMDKPRLQRMYMDFLTKEGYVPELEDQGDIAFKYQGHWYEIEIYDEDLEFGRLCFMVECEFDEMDKIYAYKAVSEVSGSFKLTKVCIRDGNLKEDKQIVVFSIGYLLNHIGDFKKYFERMVNEMLYAYKEFFEIIEKYNESENK
jgi:hypothetical protein